MGVRFNLAKRQP